MKLALDAMGGDQAPVTPIEGAVQAARETGIEVLLVGKPDIIQAELTKYDTDGLVFSIIPAT